MPDERTPALPGWYWWTDIFGGDDGQHCVRVYDAAQGISAVLPEAFGGVVKVEDATGTFGPRIPSPERLEALEAIRKAGPWDTIDHKGDVLCCRHCGITWMYPDDEPEPEHKNVCPWPAAQESKP